MEQVQQFTINLKGLALRADYDLPKSDCSNGNEDWPIPTTAEAWDRLDETLSGRDIEVYDADGNELRGVIVEINSRLGEVVVFVVNDRVDQMQGHTLRAQFSPLDMNIPPTLH